MNATPQWLPAQDAETSINAVTAAFQAAYGQAPDGVWSAPGRVNIIGEHLDYNGGRCLPMALPHRTWVAARARTDRTLRLISAQDQATWEGTIDEVGAGHPQGWAAYVAGVVWAMEQRGLPVNGLDLAVDGQVPVGAGLSSSAALECATAVAVHDLASLGTIRSDEDTAEIQRACIDAENIVAGAATGGMDQAIAMLAKPGQALLLDTSDNSTRNIRFDLSPEGLTILVIDTQAPHQLVDGQYAARRRSCEEAAEALGVSPLAALSPDADLSGLDDTTAARVRHVITETQRVTANVEALEAGEPTFCGPLLTKSHESLRDDYEVSCPELDLAVETALQAGALGARMTGGGFGGSAIALVRESDVENVAQQVVDAFAAGGFASPRFLDAPPSGGAGRNA